MKAGVTAAQSRFQAWKTAPKATASTAPRTMSTVRHCPVVRSRMMVNCPAPFAIR